MAIPTRARAHWRSGRCSVPSPAVPTHHGRRGLGRRRRPRPGGQTHRHRRQQPSRRRHADGDGDVRRRCHDAGLRPALLRDGDDHDAVERPGRARDHGHLRRRSEVRPQRLGHCLDLRRDRRRGILRRERAWRARPTPAPTRCWSPPAAPWRSPRKRATPSRSSTRRPANRSATMEDCTQWLCPGSPPTSSAGCTYRIPRAALSSWKGEPRKGEPHSGCFRGRRRDAGIRRRRRPGHEGSAQSTLGPGDEFEWRAFHRRYGQQPHPRGHAGEWPDQDRRGRRDEGLRRRWRAGHPGSAQRSGGRGGGCRR